MYSFNCSFLLLFFIPSYAEVDGLPYSSDGNESSCDAGDPGSILGSGRVPGGGNGNPVQYSCMENPIDRRTRQATVHGGRKELDTTKWLTHTYWSSAFMGNFYIMSLWEMKKLSVLFIWWLTITLDEYICLNKQWFWHHTLSLWKHNDWPSLTITWYKEMWSSMACYLVNFFRLNLPLI